MSKNYNNTYTGFIYLITNLLNNKMYVGQTTTSIENRWRGHISKSKEIHPKMAISKAIKKYGKDNFEIKEIYNETCNTKDELTKHLNEKEIYFIQEYNSTIPIGYNITKGGDNVSPKKLVAVNSYFSNGVLDKKYNSIIDAAIDRGYKNCSTLISKCCRGEMEYCLGRVWRFDSEDFNKYVVSTPQEIMDRYHCETPVDKYTRGGNLINSYKSMVDACIDLGINKYMSTPISRCCNGVTKTYYGFVWRYKGEPFDKYNAEINRTRIDQYDSNGIFIKTFDCTSDIKKELNLKSVSNIFSVCNGKKYTAYGYIWRYFGDELNKYQTPTDKKKSGRKYKKINQYLENNFIQTFDTSVEAANSVGALQTSITTACKRNGRCYGYLWFYADDPTQPDKSKIIA